MTDSRTLRTQCCIVGGGPAGITAGYLFARAGVDVLIVEKHADFFRDFRGDTIHPSTLQLLDELGLLDEFLELPHSEMREIVSRFEAKTYRLADYSHVPGRCKFVAFMPQWDFLNFMVERGRRLPGFHIAMETDAYDIMREGGRVTGVRAETPSGRISVHASLVIAADGRHSVIRERAGMPVKEVGVPIDVLWMRFSRKSSDPAQVFGSIAAGGVLVCIDRGDFFQCAYPIAKGAYDSLRARGTAYLRERIATLAPVFADRVGELRSWDDVKLLTVAVNRLKRWYLPGLLFIGDAAHAMSPVAGVGINLAIQDAVAAANRLSASLRRDAVSVTDLRAVQRRREPPTRATQALQVVIQNAVIQRILKAQRRISPPFGLRALDAWPLLRRIPARIVGIGFRPEHVRHDLFLML